MQPLKVGVVGVGHLGKEHARILSGLRGADLVGVVDVDPGQAQAVAERCGTQVFASATELANHVDAACIVVPTKNHHSVAAEFLARGIPTLVEKPLALNLEQANDLVALARKHRTILQVGHIERFNPAYEELRGRSINPKFVECERHGTFTGRSTDIGAVLDLMIHDLDLLLDLVGGPVVDVQALAATVFGGHEDLANARLKFAGGCVAHLTASRMTPVPKRKLRIWAPEGYAGIDFVRKSLTLVQPSEELRQRRIEFQELDPPARAQLKDQVFTRHLQTVELNCNHGDQLTRELEHFLHCVRTGTAPRVGGEQARDAIALATRILASAQEHVWEPEGAAGPDAYPPPTGGLISRDEPLAA
ncbi:MAG TPA: Gfo/Idh/MocA family oxidoreductase [Gemmataceae bacterium]|jgi:predicted dehydrogenase|nr:Gfo/Idh/MocA family oxidoreductase [Gemmataceae bacterium]